MRLLGVSSSGCDTWVWHSGYGTSGCSSSGCDTVGCGVQDMRLLGVSSSGCDTVGYGIQHMRLLGVSSSGYDTVSVRCVVPSSSGSRNASCHSGVAYTVIISVCDLESFL